MTELDRLLAEKVMGWTLTGVCWYEGEFSIGYSTNYLIAIWHPTTDIAQAFMVWEKMLALTTWKMNCLRFVGDANGEWCIDGPRLCVYADTPALAISLAAKAWLEESK